MQCKRTKLHNPFSHFIKNKVKHDGQTEVEGVGDEGICGVIIA
jgi:hypothetical protein